MLKLTKGLDQTGMARRGIDGVNRAARSTRCFAEVVLRRSSRRLDPTNGLGVELRRCTGGYSGRRNTGGDELTEVSSYRSLRLSVIRPLQRLGIGNGASGGTLESIRNRTEAGGGLGCRRAE